MAASRIHFDHKIRIVRAARLSYVIDMATNAILSEDETMTRTLQPVRKQIPARIAGQVSDLIQQRIPERIPEQINDRRWQAVAARDASLECTIL